ncbi:uncharacterized protein LOC119465228 isoform X1 [Dermacentor silvarum]|uniref:uncharacterized protein LOC119465228 isoform X1 n=1 Tax=Dermacentor silvarum TaxID=543639 RepID=UPI001899BF36|nr:uncharacterized protein LOC119465228 isoform X1 [Dermacentor silvarum]
MAPRNWKRPLTLIYNDNYKYGNSLYSGALDDIEKRYQASLSRTTFRADRGDLGLSTFSSSNIGSAPEPSAGRPATTATNESDHALLSPSFSAPSRSPVRSMLDAEHDLRKARSQGDFGRLRSSALRPNSWSDEEALMDDQSYTRRRRRRKQDRSDFLLSSPTVTAGENIDYYYDKCRELKNELEALHGRVLDAEARARSEAGTLRNKVQTEIADLSVQLEDTTSQNNELQKAVKRQAKQLMDLQAYCDEMQRHLQGAVDDLSTANKRCLDLQNEVDSLRSNLESGLGMSRYASLYGMRHI